MGRIDATTIAMSMNSMLALTKASCPNQSCNGELDAASALGAASTAGLVIGGIGIAAGTAVLLLVQPGAPGPAAGTSVRAGLGPGGLHLEGSF